MDNSFSDLDRTSYNSPLNQSLIQNKALYLSNFVEVQRDEEAASVQFSHSVVTDSLQPRESQHARPPCPSQTAGVHSDSRPSSQWCRPAISSSVVPFSSCRQSLPASVFSNESTLRMRWPKYWSFSFSIFPSKEIPGLISFRMTGWISLQSKGLSRAFSNTTAQKHQFFGTQPSSQSNSHIHTWPLEKP